MATAFARDYRMMGRISATKNGKITGLHCHTSADHGAFDACADPTKLPAGLVSSGSRRHRCRRSFRTISAVDGIYTNKAPGGVAYRRSFRVTEAAYFIERMIEVLAIKLGMDAAGCLNAAPVSCISTRQSRTNFLSISIPRGLCGPDRGFSAGIGRIAAHGIYPNGVTTHGTAR